MDAPFTNGSRALAGAGLVVSRVSFGHLPQASTIDPPFSAGSWGPFPAADGGRNLDETHIYIQPPPGVTKLEAEGWRLGRHLR